TQEIPINGRETIDVSMQSKSVLGEEVVVVGYGVQRKSDLTGSVSSIRGEALTAPAVTNPAQALQGAASGVRVVSAGEPGSSPSINIRGIGTTGDSSPLYVIDGVFTNDISYLNNNDIESIEVLKDASATAIYGSRGANGVVLITTKQGSSETPVFNFSMSEGIEVPTSYSMVNARQYATLINEGLVNIGEEPKYDVSQINNSTDWFDEVMDRSAVREYNLSFSQGTDKSSYYVSLGYDDQNGVVEKSGYERFSVRVNNRYHLSNNITIGHNMSGNWTNKDNRLGPAFGWTYRVPSTIPVRNEDGSYASTGIGSNGNVIAALDHHHDFTKSRALVGNAFVEIKFLDNFQFKSSLGIDLKHAENTVFNPVFFVDNDQKNEQSSLSKEWGKTQNWLWENTLNYSQTFDIHQIDAVVGFTTQENNFETLGGERNNIFSEDRNLWYLNAGATEGLGNSNIASSSSIVSYLGRINYTLMDKYLFTGTIRFDGSSKFPEDDRWGTFPSFALGWRLSEEPFMQDVEWLSDLKIRGSWGQIGNQKIGDYRYYATAATGIGVSGIFGNEIDRGATVTTLVNQNVTWEKSEQTDIGLQFGLLNNKIEGEVDWYKRTTKDMLVEVGVPGSVGLDATEGNVGSVENRGFEFSLNFNGSKNDWTYNIGLRASTINNEVVDLGSRDELIGGNIGAGKQVSRARVGEPIGFFYGYKSLGPFDTQKEIDNAATQSNVVPGDLRMADTNGDGEITAEDRVKIGSPIPDYTGGLNIAVGYKGLELSVDMYGSFGNEIYDGNNNVRFSGDDNFSKQWLDRWTGPGTSNEIPRITFGGDWNYEISSRWVDDGSFVKIQNVRLQYTLPSSLLESLPISNAKIYVSGNNLHYFTKYDGLTPEIPGTVINNGEITNPGNPANSTLNKGVDSNVYPVSSFYQLGASITF
ncbi:MAG TPA: TonB-dependent receptor, partial [Fodinibius sp.]|nr:TonB-dependent receptor [Fodinibius sp.]